MMKRSLKTVYTAAAALAFALPGAAQAAATVSFHEVPWGMVKVDLNLDGESDLVVHSWPEDDLSQTTEQVQFLIFDREHDDGLRSVRIDGLDKPMFLLPAQKDGACKSYDFALMATGRTRETRRFDMVYMHRSDDVDAEGNGKVTFEHYKLEKDEGDAAETGGNPYVYVKDGEYVATEVYCDVKDAFADNLETLEEEFQDPDPRLMKKHEAKKSEDKAEEKK